MATASCAWPFPEKKLPGDRDYEKFLAGKKYQHTIRCHFTTLDGRELDGPLKPLEGRQFIYGGLNLDFLPRGTRVELRDAEQRRRYPKPPLEAKQTVIIPGSALNDAQERYLQARGYHQQGYGYPSRQMEWKGPLETDPKKWPAMFGEPEKQAAC